MPAVAATNPPVLIAMVAAATERIRVGSGGVMLPNHAPLVVAEQFALLEAAYPGPDRPRHRPRARHRPASPAIALRHGAGGVTDDAVEQFPEYVDDIVAMMSPGGVATAGQRPRAPAATPPRRPTSRGRPSGCSAPRTTPPGSPRPRDSPTSSPTTSPAAAPPRRSTLYRSSYRPSERHPEPRTFLTVNAVVAPTPGRGRAARPAQPAVDGQRSAPAAAAHASAARRGGRGARPARAAPRAGRPDDRALGGRYAGRGGRAGGRAGRDVRRRRGDAPPGRRRVRQLRRSTGPRTARRRCDCSPTHSDISVPRRPPETVSPESRWAR